MTTPAVSPRFHTMAVSERHPLVFDASPNLGDTGMVGAVSTAMVDIATGGGVALGNEPTVAGEYVTQIVDGPTELVAGHHYLLSVNFNAVPDVTEWTMELEIIAVE